MISSPQQTKIMDTDQKYFKQNLTFNGENSFSISQTKSSGRGLFATKFISRDENVFSELPAVVGPPQNISSRFCCKCGLNAQLGKTFTECGNLCGLMVCSNINACVKNLHTNDECGIIKAAFQGQCPPNPGVWLTIFRVLLLNVNGHAEIGSALRRLHHHNQQSHSKSPNVTLLSPIFKLIQGFDSMTVDDVVQVSGILDSNSFRVDGSGSRALFLMASMINHNCCPNARVVFDKNHQVTLKAKRDIQAGEEITITYCCHLLGTPQRLVKLQKSKFFTCCCKRCQDQTESGTFMSSLKCPKCSDHVLPRKEFSQLTQTTEWGCLKCPFTTSNSKVQDYIKSIEKGISDVKLRFLNDVTKLEDHLIKRQKILPQRHYLLMGLKLDILNGYDSVRTLESVQRRLEIINERISLLSEVDEGCSRLLGFMHYRKQLVLVEMVSILQKSGKLESNVAQNIGQQIRTSLEIAFQCLNGDGGCPEDLPLIIKSMRQDSI